MRISTTLLFSVFLALPLAKTQDFIRIEQLAGIDHVSHTNGVAVADYDRDGDLDIFFTGINNFEAANPSTWNRLLRNRGDGTFEDVTVEAGFGSQFINTGILAARGEKMGASWGDYDNDGYPDLFLANSRLDQLYHNMGNGSFEDVTTTAGVAGCDECYSSSGQWWDHDRDGDLDLYVSILNGDNFMYQNQGDGTFIDVTAFEELAGAGITWSSTSLDVGKDGILDLYVINDTQINQFYENRSGFRYNEASRAYRLSDEGAGMGVAIGDPNNDGFFDIYVTNIYNHQPNPLFINSGNREFENKAKEMGVDNSGWGWGTHFFDYDHDGDEDLYAVNGPIDKLNGTSQADTTNILFKNMMMEGFESFQNRSAQSGANEQAKGKGMEVFDFDNDGDLDIVVANMEDTAHLFRNETIQTVNQASDRNWLKIKLEGTLSNRDAFGTEVQIVIDGKSFYRWHQGAAIFGGSIKPVHFGLGAATVVDEIKITWLSGVSETYTQVLANQTILIKESVGLTPTNDKKALASTHSFSYPNPFSTSTQLHFELQSAGQLNLRIRSLSGQEVFRHTQSYSDGPLDISWDGLGKDGSPLPAGTYFYIAQFGGNHLIGKLIKI